MKARPFAVLALVAATLITSPAAAVGPARAAVDRGESIDLAGAGPTIERYLDEYGCGDAAYVVDGEMDDGRAMVYWRTPDTVNIAPNQARSGLEGLIAHECMHVRQNSVFGWDAAYMNHVLDNMASTALGEPVEGSMGAELLADCMAELAGAGESSGGYVDGSCPESLVPSADWLLSVTG